MKAGGKQMKFWSYERGSGLVFCKLRGELLLFDPGEFYTKVEEVMELDLDESRRQDIGTFRHIVRTGGHLASVLNRFHEVEGAVFARLQSEETQLRTTHAFEGVAAMDALEDMFTVVAYNRSQRSKDESEVFVDSRPLQGASSDFWIRVRRVKRRNWLKRRMAVDPKTLDEFSFLRSDVLRLVFTPYTWSVTTRHGQALCDDLGPHWEPT